MSAPQLTNLSVREENDTEWIDATFDNGTTVAVTDKELAEFFLRKHHAANHILVSTWESFSELPKDTVLQDTGNLAYYLIDEDATGERFIYDFESGESLSFNNMQDAFPGVRLRVVNISGI